MTIHDYVHPDYYWLYQIGALALLVLFVNLIISSFFHSISKYFDRNNKRWQAAFFYAINMPINTFVWFFAAACTLYIVDQRFDTPIGFEQFSTVVDIATILALTWFFFRFKTEYLKRASQKSKQSEAAFDAATLDLIDKMATVVLVFISMIALLQATGNGVATLLTLGGIGAAAVGFASKEFIANFFGGFVIYLTKPFKLGDVVNIPQRNLQGVIEEIGWYMTTLRDFEKQPVFIPNSTFSQVYIVTPSGRSHRLINETIGIRYRDRGVLIDIIKDIELFLKDHPCLDHRLRQTVSFASYGESSLNISVFSYTKSVDIAEFSALKQDILIKLGDIVSRHGADFPFTTYTLDIEDKKKRAEISGISSA